MSPNQLQQPSGPITVFDFVIYLNQIDFLSPISLVVFSTETYPYM